MTTSFDKWRTQDRPDLRPFDESPEIDAMPDPCPHCDGIGVHSGACRDSPIAGQVSLAQSETWTTKLSVNQERLAEGRPAIKAKTQLGDIHTSHVYIPGPCSIRQEGARVWVEVHGEVVGEWTA